MLEISRYKSHHGADDNRPQGKRDREGGEPGQRDRACDRTRRLDLDELDLGTVHPCLPSRFLSSELLAYNRTEM